jgi:hypothetical protein
MSKTVIEIAPRKILGYILLAIGIFLFLYVAIVGLLLATGTTQPLKVATQSYPTVDVIAGMGLQIGICSVLTGVAFAIAKIGLSLIIKED